MYSLRCVSLFYVSVSVKSLLVSFVMFLIHFLCCLISVLQHLLKGLVILVLLQSLCSRKSPWRLIKCAVFLSIFMLEGWACHCQPIWLEWEMTSIGLHGSALYLGGSSIQRINSVVHCLVQGGKGGARLTRMPFLICSPEFPGLNSWPLPSVSYHLYLL